MFKDYKEQCENFVKAWIDKNTRYKSKDISLQDYKEFNIDLSVEVSNTFKVVTQKVTANLEIWNKLWNKEVKQNINFHNETYYTKREYDTAVDREIKLHDVKENFEHLFGLVEKGSYATFKEHAVFLIGETRLVYEFKCPTCKGQGMIKCNCRGGKVQCSAWSCKNGRIKKTERKNGHTRTYYVDCDRCQGTGGKLVLNVAEALL